MAELGDRDQNVADHDAAVGWQEAPGVRCRNRTVSVIGGMVTGQVCRRSERLGERRSPVRGRIGVASEALHDGENIATGNAPVP